MLKKDAETVDHLFLHCAVVQLFGPWFSLVGVSRVMPCSVFMDYWLTGRGILVGEGYYCLKRNLSWRIWLERNKREFESEEQAMGEHKFGFLKVSMSCSFRALGSLLSFIDDLNLDIVVVFLSPPYFQ
jgi:hypothetical protein